MSGSARTRDDEQRRSIDGRWRTLVVAALFTLVGINLRTVILAVPPILPLIKHDLAISYTATGLLTSLPILVFGAAAWPASTLAGRIGARRTVIFGLALLALGTLLRAVWVAAVPLYVFTVLLSLGVAVGQTAMPVLARQWFPQRIGLVSALFTDGLILGETLGAGLTVPIMLGFLGVDAWPATFIVWGIPVVVMLALWLWLAPAAPALNSRAAARIAAESVAAQATPIVNSSIGSASGVAKSASPPRRTVRSWHLGILLGAASLIFFSMNAWIATYNQALHRSALTSTALLVLNAAQLPVSLGMTPFAQQLAGRRWPFLIAGGTCLFAIAGWLLMPGATEPLWVALLGGSSAFVFVLGIALPPLLASREQVARLTGITLTLSYGIAFAGPLLGGGLWDLFQLPALAFVPVMAASLALLVLGAMLPPRSAFGLHSEDAEPSSIGNAQAANATTLA